MDKTPPILCGCKVDAVSEERQNDDNDSRVMYLTAPEIQRGKFKWSSDEKIGDVNFYRFTKKCRGNKTNRSQLQPDIEHLGSSIAGPSRRPDDSEETSGNGDKTKSSTLSKSDNSDPDVINIQDMGERWKDDKFTQSPKLVLWLVGSLDEQITDETKRKQSLFINRVVCRELVSLTAKSDSWLICQCNESELFKYIGAAIEDHSLCAENKTATVIGLTRWPYVEGDASLVEISQVENVKEHIIIYQHKNSQTRAKLSQNIGYYVHSDSPGSCVLETSDISGNIIKDLFQCVVAMNGDGSTIWTLKQKAEENIPIILIDGTGGITQWLIDIKSRTTTDEREKMIDSLVFDYCRFLSNLEQEALKNAVAHVVNYENLIILDTGDNKLDTKIERTIVENISKDMLAQTEVISEIKDMNFQHLCIYLNMYDVFRTHQGATAISDKIRKNTLQSYSALKAIKLDQVDFVRQFIGEDKNFKKSISKQDLKELYNQAGLQFEDVPNQLNAILGSFYEPDQMYKSKTDAANNTSKGETLKLLHVQYK